MRDNNRNRPTLLNSTSSSGGSRLSFIFFVFVHLFINWLLVDRQRHQQRLRLMLLSSKLLYINLVTILLIMHFIDFDEICQWGGRGRILSIDLRNNWSFTNSSIANHGWLRALVSKNVLVYLSISTMIALILRDISNIFLLVVLRKNRQNHNLLAWILVIQVRRLEKCTFIYHSWHLSLGFIVLILIKFSVLWVHIFILIFICGLWGIVSFFFFAIAFSFIIKIF